MNQHLPGAESAPMIEDLYRSMKRIRLIEETLIGLVAADEVPGSAHFSIGQEAVAVGVCSVLRDSDVITSTHRGHGHVIAKGASAAGVIAELMGKETGPNKGRGGSMHVADLSKGIYGANGMVGGGVPFAVGAAWAAKQDGTEAVAVAFFGDGALQEGILLESMNMASLWGIPVVFVCENNGYAVTLRVEDGVAGSPVARAASFDMPASKHDGMNVVEVREAAERAVAHARAGNGPSYLEFETYRYEGHQSGEESLRLDYRQDAEVQEWRKRDPLLHATSLLAPDIVERIDAEIEEEIAIAVDFARNSPEPSADTATEYMYEGLEPRKVFES